MQVVATPIMTSVITRVVLRPILSPRCPKMIPPIGRATNPAHSVRKDNKVAVPGARSAGKNTLPKTRAAAMP
ncbi:hypothetical protein D3C73_1373350 [compost metagenome]